MPVAEPVLAGQSSGGTEVYTSGTPVTQPSHTTDSGEHTVGLRRLRNRNKTLNYCEDSDNSLFGIFTKMRGKAFFSEKKGSFKRHSKTLESVRRMLGRKDYSLSNVERQVGLMNITAKYASVESSRQLIQQRLDKVDKHPLPPTSGI